MATERSLVGGESSRGSSPISNGEGDDGQMTDTGSDHMHVTIHLIQQATVEFDAADLWPLHGAYSRFGADLDSFAEEVTRRLRIEGYLGFRAASDTISVIPLSAVKRIDFAVRA
jgi:hypothetical protein